MRPILRFLWPLWLVLIAAFGAKATEPAPFILVDQFGYLPELQKRAVIRDPQIGFDAARSFTPGQRYVVIRAESGQVVFEGRPIAWNKGRTDPDSGDRVWWFDFSSVRAPGDYVIRDVERGVESDRFRIAPDVYTPVLKTAFKTFYYQRAGFEKRAPFAAKGYRDRASHLGRGQDGQARLFTRKDDAKSARDLRGGWYDAGDYNKYTGWTAQYVSQLLFAYLENPNVWTDDFGIPESGNGQSDLLDEVVWGLDWLERMQNQDGSMLSIMGLASASPPSKASGPSYYGPPNTSATLASSAAFATAARVFSNTPGQGERASRYANRAKRAWGWAEANPKVIFKNNDGASGTEGLAAGQQEVDAKRRDKLKLMAASQLYSAFRDPVFLTEVQSLYKRVNPMTDGLANGFEGDMGFILLDFAQQADVPPRFANRIKRDYRDKVLNAYNGMAAVRGHSDAYGAPVDGYWWGSNSTKMRRGSVLTQAIIGEAGDAPPIDYLNAASGYINYIHGVNPMGLVYLSNMNGQGAERSVSEFYHAWFENDSRLYDSNKTSQYGPAPGFLVGGPNSGYERDACCKTTCGGYGAKLCQLPVKSPPSGQPPAKSYAEFNDGWPLNSWSVTENSNSYQVSYLRLLSKFAR